MEASRLASILNIFSVKFDVVFALAANVYEVHEEAPNMSCDFSISTIYLYTTLY